VSLTAYLISQRVIFDSWLTLILASVVVTGFYSGIVYLCGLNPQERTLLKNLIPRVR